MDWLVACYAVTHTRSDVAAKLGEIQSQMFRGTVATLISADKDLREALEFAHVKIFSDIFLFLKCHMFHSEMPRFLVPSNYHLIKEPSYMCHQPETS